MPTTKATKGRGVVSAERREQLSLAFDSARQEFTAEIERGRGGRAAATRFSGHIDVLLRGIIEATREQTQTPVAVWALGGYGRRTLCLHSDIDLLVLFGRPIGRAEERFLRGLLHPLWDLRLTLGHHVRELTDFEHLETDNPEFLLALLDARPLDGDRAVIDRFDTLRPGWSAHAAPQTPLILDALLALTEQRHAQFNDTLYQLEPDVKDAPGGLRDIWATRTVARLAGLEPAVASAAGVDRLDEAEELLLRIRSMLHLEAGRNLNVLSHEWQEKAAERLGYPGAELRQRVEALMGDYFRHARTVTHALARTRRAARPAPPEPLRLNGDNLMLVAEGVAFADPARAATEPASWIDAFGLAVARHVPVSDTALATIEQHVGRYAPNELVPTDRHRQRLLQFLQPRPGLAARLSEMHDCGLLGGVFPEFLAISCRVIRDFYHRYTVDEHTLLTIRQIERLLDQDSPSGSRFGPVLRELHAPELLVLSLLFHDVGKCQDENHADVGAEMAQVALQRLGFPPDARQTIEFLIRNHLQMSRVAFRRDTEDPDVVRRFAALFPTEEHLKLLLLLTLADVGAVSPDTLTPWKEELLWRLYVDAYNHMTLGYGDEVIDRNQAVLAALQANRPDDISEADMAAFLEGLPRRYLTLFDAASVYRHVRLSRDIHPHEVHLVLEHKSDVWEITVVTLDKPYLFSNICGVLSYFGMDILRGHAMTSLGGLVLDVFQFTDREGFFLHNPEARPQFEQLLANVVAGRSDLVPLLQRKERSVVYRQGPLRSSPVIYFDNEYSQRYTVLELVADDALGLLHRISRVISRHGCDVDLVLISTEGQKAVDVFHITKGGAKLMEPAQLALKADLKRMLEERYETH